MASIVSDRSGEPALEVDDERVRIRVAPASWLSLTHAEFRHLAREYADVAFPLPDFPGDVPASLSEQLEHDE